MTSRSEDMKTPLATFAFTKDAMIAKDTGRVDKSGKPIKQYQLTMLFDKQGTDRSAFEKAALEAAAQAFGDKAAEWIKSGMIKSPFLDGDGPQGLSKKTGERKAGHAGRWFIRCTSGEEFPPKIFNKRLVPITDVKDFQSGDKGYGVVHAYAWENKENGKGISFGFSMVQVTDTTGERLGGSGSLDPESFFEKIEDNGPAPSSTQDGSGAAGLFG